MTRQHPNRLTPGTACTYESPQFLVIFAIGEGLGKAVVVVTRRCRWIVRTLMRHLVAEQGRQIACIPLPMAGVLGGRGQPLMSSTLTTFPMTRHQTVQWVLIPGPDPNPHLKNHNLSVSEHYALARIMAQLLGLRHPHKNRSMFQETNRMVEREALIRSHEVAPGEKLHDEAFNQKIPLTLMKICRISRRRLPFGDPAVELDQALTLSTKRAARKTSKLLFPRLEPLEGCLSKGPTQPQKRTLLQGGINLKVNKRMKISLAVNWHIDDQAADGECLRTATDIQMQTKMITVINVRT